MALPKEIENNLPSRFRVGAVEPSASSILTSFEVPKVQAPSSQVATGAGPLGLVRTIAQETARTGASVALTLTGKPELAVDPTAPKAEQRIQRILFGDTPVESIPIRITKAKEKLKPIVGEKLALPTAAVGIVGLTVADFLPGGKAARQAVTIAKSTNITDISRVLKGLKISEESIPNLSQQLVKVTNPAEVGKIISSVEKAPTIPKLRVGVSRQIADEAIEVAKRDPDSGLLGKEFRDPITKERIGGPRLFQRIGDALESGEINLENLPDIVKQYNLTGEEAAKLFKDAATFSGRTLQSLSRVEKELRKLLPDLAPEALKIAPTPWQIFKAKFQTLENFRRGLLVSQLATAMRNTISQGGRYSLEIVNDAFSSVINKVAGKPEPFAAVVEDIAVFFRRNNSENLDKITKLLNKNPLESARLLNTPIGDIALGNKVTNVLNTPNRFQEYFYRNLILDAKLHTFARQRGVDITKLNSDEIARAVDQALELTFAATPKSGSFLNDVYRAYRAMPFSTVLLNPFPRFHVNALRFLFQHSPLGLMSLFSKETRAAIAAGDPKVISRAMSGILMLSAATVIRNNPNYGGEKWYELKVAGKRIDLRPFAPFSTYLFFAELFSHPERLTGNDFAQAALSINRIAGTGLAVVDLFQTGTPENVTKFAKEFAGQYLGGFTVPFRTVADVVSEFRPKAQALRDVREQPIIGPAIANIPFAQEKLPELPSFFEEEPLRREKPLLRQLTGITVKTKPYIQQEIDRLGLQTKDMIPKTGDPKINRIIIKATGEILNNFNDALENSEKYQSLNDVDKIDFIKSLVSEGKKEAKGKVAQDIAVIVYNEIKKESKENRSELINKLKNKGLLTENILDFLLPMIEARPFNQ